ncbi:MAG: phenylacetate--CoA ligase [Deltaproteobacteria bacterium]|nr:phenylacetate--CoA ligase [Deltaproteobacteria bacterium]
MSKFWDEKFETMPYEEMAKFQLAKLKETLAWVYEKVPFYRKTFDHAGLKPTSVGKLEDLARFPFSIKNDLRDNYPFGLCALPMKDLVRIHASSGTTGKPITGPYSREDRNQWANCMARTLYSHGVREDDLCQNAYGYGLFTGGLGFHLGAELIGCAIVPTSSGLTERQIVIMQDFGSNVLFSTPTYALTIAEKAEKMGVDMKSLPLRVGCFGAEPWTPKMRDEIEKRMGIIAHEAYGLTEMMGPGVAFSCEARNLHINEDHCYPEVIDPETLQPLPMGETGELVFTALQRRAMPLIRYRTKDITRLVRTKCDCGRTLITMDKITGRDDDMLIISGVNVFPSQVESVIMEFKDMEPHYQIRVRKKGYLDVMLVEAEAKRVVYEAGKESVQKLADLISDRILQVIGITVPISIVPMNSIPRSEGKAKRVIDER